MILWLVACTCTEPVPDTLPRPGHFTELDSLVRAVARSDLPASRQIARDLSAGDVDEDHEGASAVGAALGFAQVAEAADELPFAVSRAAAGCGACHADRDVVAPEPPPFTHAGVAERAVYGVVWGVSEPLPPDVELEPAVVEAWAAEDRVTAVLEACQARHLEP